LECIDPDPAQVRGHNNLEAEAFAEMCANVAEFGVLQPLLVRPGNHPGRYVLIAGEYRYEAARRAGHTNLPCYIEEAALDQTTLFLHQLSENLHRQALSHMDLARAFYWLTLPVADGGGGLRAAFLARRLSKSEAFISEHRALLHLSLEDQKRLEEGALSFDQARAKVRASKARKHTEADPAANDPTEGPLASNGTNGHSLKIPSRLDNGQYIYGPYSRGHTGTNLAVLIVGPDKSEPALDAVVRLVERHLHYLKLKLARKKRTEAE
jgi:ParB/RepB/Spo0J family partition protein